MFPTLMVTFREGLEAFLIVSVTLLYLRQTRRTQLIPALHWATFAAVSFSAGLGWLLARIGGLSPLHEAWLAAAALLLVLSCTVHMLRHGKQIAGQIRSRIDAAHSGTLSAAKAGVFAFVFLMISREGVETATMLASLAGSVALRHLALGGAVGVLLAALLALAWSRFGARIDFGRFFQVTAIFMVLFSLQLLIYMFHEFTEAGAVPGIDNPRWHVLTEPYGPEGAIGAWLSYSLVLIPIVFILATSVRSGVGHDQRRRFVEERQRVVAQIDQLEDEVAALAGDIVNPVGWLVAEATLAGRADDDADGGVLMHSPKQVA